jgi:ligand-binding sensor domain-containing protein
MKRRMVYVCAMAGCIVAVATAGVGTWKNFTSLKDVKDIAQSGDTVWAATSGGLFSWNEGASTYRIFTNAEGLQNIDLTAIGIDRLGDIWTGTSTGVLHILSPTDGSWRYVLDIALTNQTNKRINRLAVYGDTILICTDFGLSVFDREKFEFGDTFSKFGNLSIGVRISVWDAAIYDGKIWAAISDGQGNNRLAVASLSNPNLLPREAWSLQIVGGALGAPVALSVFNNQLYAGTSAGLYVLQGGTWVAVRSLENAPVVRAATSANLLAVCTASSEVFTIDAQNSATQFGPALPFPPTSLSVTAANDVIIGSLNGGVLSLQGSWSAHVPNGPASNQFISVTLDADGAVWGASGNANGSGFYRYDGKSWKSFTVANSNLPSNDYFRISIGCNGAVWASSYGRGVVEIPRGVDSVDANHVYGQNVGMVGVPNDPSFVVVGNVVCDSRGNTWMSIVNAADKNVLVVRRADGPWQTFPALIGNAKVGFLMDVSVDRCLAVDAFDNIWATVREGAYKGVISLGNRGSIDSTAAFHFTTANGLPGDDIRTVVVDKNNEVWVGTDKGIGIILDPANPLREGGIAAYRPLSGLVVNTIAIDPLNQKWVGTTEGVILLSPDGTQQIATYTAANTSGKMIENDVKSIAFDAQSGTVYFGTLSGLASLTTDAPAPKPSFDELTIAPNPFLVPSTTPLTIDGLVDNSGLKILSIDGRLIRELRTPGGRIGFWDGKDKNGQDVASGVYVITAFSEDGNQVATSKVAVIRR